MVRLAIHGILGGVLCLFLSSCGSSSTTGDNTSGPVTGTVKLPVGYAQPASNFKVVGVNGDSLVDANGQFVLPNPGSGTMQVDLLDPDGKVVLVGLLKANGCEVSARSTAIVLTYYALGGFTLPAEHQGTLYDLVAQTKAVDDLAAVLETKLAADPLVLTNGDDNLTQAIAAARRAITGEPAAKTFLAKARAKATAKDDTGTNISVDPAGTVPQSGVQIMPNPGGSGILAQNNFRRYATFLVYQTGTEDSGGNKTMYTTPQAVGTAHDITSTSRLELFSAISDCFTGHAPFSPVTTNPVDLPLADGSAKTFYDIIVLGPAFESAYPPIFQDTRYFGFAQDWNGQITRLNFKMFWLDFAWPAIETFLFVKGASIQNEKLENFVTDFKALCDKRLASLGVYVFKEKGDMVIAMNLLLNALKDDTFRLEFVDMCKKALTESALNQANFQAMAQKLKGRASASAIVAAVNIALEVGDLYKVMEALNQSRSGEVWTATVLPPNVHLDPGTATVTQNSPSAAFTASVKGAASGAKFVYRWSTPGGYGVLSDVHGQQGKSFDSTYSVVNYMADVGAIKNGNLDTVTVEVFADDGSGAIPAGATSLGKATSQVTGQRSSEGGPVTLTLYSSNQPDPGDMVSVTANVQGGTGEFIYAWSTSGNCGHLRNDGAKEFEGSSTQSYWANDNATDQQTDWIKVQVYRMEGGNRVPVGSAEATIDIWNPTTYYSICNAAGTLVPYGPYPEWNLNSGWWLKGHGPIYGNMDFRARSGDQLWFHIDDVGHTVGYGPAYVRKGKKAEPLQESPTLLFGEQTFNPPTDLYFTVP
jgi:hypothetical protein